MSIPRPSLVDCFTSASELRRLDPALSRQAARKIVRDAKKQARRSPNPTTRTIVHGHGVKRWTQTLRLGHDHPAPKYIPGCKYQREMLVRLGAR